MDTKRDQGPLLLAMPPFRERPAQAGTKQQAEAVGPGTSRTSRTSHSQVVRLLVLALTGWGQQRHSRQAGALLNCFYKNKNIVFFFIKTIHKQPTTLGLGSFLHPTRAPAESFSYKAGPGRAQGAEHQRQACTRELAGRFTRGSMLSPLATLTVPCTGMQSEPQLFSTRVLSGALGWSSVLSGHPCSSWPSVHAGRPTC